MYSLINIFLEKFRCKVYLQRETLVNTCYTKEDCQQCFKKQLFLKCWYISIENIYKLLLILTICLTLTFSRSESLQHTPSHSLPSLLQSLADHFTITLAISLTLLYNLSCTISYSLFTWNLSYILFLAVSLTLLLTLSLTL